MSKQKFKNLLWAVARLTPVVLIVLSAALSLVGIFGHTKRATAATNSTLNFQARLLTAAGSTVADGNYNIEFKLYNASSSSGSSQGSCSGDVACLWTETRYDSNGPTAGNDNRVRVVNGYLTVNLGSVNSFAGTINWDQELWLTMNIGGSTQTATPTWDGEMTPRLKLTAVPYAFRAGQLVTQSGALTSTLSFAAPTTTSKSITIPDETGTICLQSSSACGFLTPAAANSAYIQNSTSPQTANFNVRSAATGSVTGVLQGANGQTADIFNVQTWNGSSATTVFGVGSTGDLAVQNVNVAAGKSITLASGTGKFNQTYSTNVTGSAAQSITLENTNTGASSVTIYGQEITTTSQPAGPDTNHIAVFRFLGPTGTGGGNTFTALQFANSAYTNILQVNGTQIINGSGVVQSAGINGSYTSLTGVGTITTGTWQGSVVGVQYGGTGAATFTSNGVLYGNGTGALQATAAGTTGQCLVATTSAAPSWGSCGAGSGVTTVGTFSASAQTNGASISGSTITFGPADASTPGMVSTGTQTIAGAKTFNSSLNVASGQGYQINSSTVLTASALSFTAAGTASIQPASSQALTITAHAASTWSTDSGLLTLQGAGGVTVTATGTTAATVDSAGAGSVLLGNTNATTVTLGNAGSTTTSIQGNTAINIGTSSTGGTITLGGTANTGQISIGNASNTSAQTIAIGTGGTGVKTITLGGTAANVIAIGNSQTAGSISIGTAMTSGTVTIGSNGTSGATTLQSGSGNVNILTNSAAAKVVIKSGVNDDTAFQVQDSGNNPVLNVDTSNVRLGIGTATPSRTLHAYVSNTQTTAPMALLEQAGTGDATLEFKTPAMRFAAGLDASDGNKFKISSTTASDTAVTLGYTFIGGTTDSGNSGIVVCNKHTASTTGTVVSMSVHVGTVDSAPNNQFQVGIYTDSGGNPTTLVANSSSGTLTSNSWNTVNISASLTASNVYWLCYETNGSSSAFNDLHFNTGAAGSANWKAGTSMGTWPSNFGSPSGPYDANYSMYVTYSSAGGYDSFNKALFTLGDTGQATFQNSTDSTTAFQIQNAAGTAQFYADTSNSRVYIGATSGDTTGALLVLDTKTDSGDPTGVNGGMYYNSNANKFRCYQSGAWTDCIGTGGSGARLDQITAATGNATIASGANNIVWNWQLTAAEVGMAFGETAASTGGGTNNQFVLQSSTVSGSTASPLRVTSNSVDAADIVFNLASAGDFVIQDNGTAVWTFNDNGTTLFKPSADNATAFEIQKAASTTQLFIIDSSNNRVYVGDDTSDTTGTLLVLDTKSDTGDPTGVNGGLYYNGADNDYRAYHNGRWTNLQPVRYVYLSADRTNSTVNYADVTDLSFAVDASTNYEIECNIVYQTAIGSTGIGIGLNGPANPNLVTGVFTTAVNGTGGAGATTFTGYDAGGATGGVTTANTNSQGFFKGYFRNGTTAGTLQVRFKSEVAASAAVVKANSYCTIAEL